jgi:acyl dehydratase
MEWTNTVEETDDGPKVKDEKDKNNALIAPKRLVKALCGQIMLSSQEKIALKGIKAVENVNWKDVIYSGDTLYVSIEITEDSLKSDGSSLPEVQMKVIGQSQNGDRIVEYSARFIIERRN